MRIKQIDVGIVEVPLSGIFATAHSTRESQRAVVVRVSSESGVDGWGSVEPTQGYSRCSVEGVSDAVRQLGPRLIGLDAMNFRRAHDVMRERCDIPEARAVVEMGLFDLAGRALKVSVWRLLGGAIRQVVRLNAWIGVVPPEKAADEAAAWAQQGFTSAKVKVGHNLQEDIERVAAVRAATGSHFEIRVDANEGLDVDQSICLGLALQKYDISLFEQPIPREDIEGLATIRKRIRVPIMADESVHGPESVLNLIHHEAADLIKVKVMKQGGLIPTLQTAEVAAAGGLRVVIGHGFGLWLSTMAEVHLAATCSAIIDGVECVGPLKVQQDIVSAPPQITNGNILVPDSPGLGVEPNKDLLESLGWRPTIVL